MNRPYLPCRVAFYSYKGGAGRSVTCANVAYHLVRSFDKSTALLDFDTESAGQGYIHRLRREWILGQDPTRLYVQDVLSGVRLAEHQAVPVETIDLKRDEFMLCVGRMFVDLTNRQAPQPFDHDKASSSALDLLLMSRQVADPPQPGVLSKTAGNLRALLVALQANLGVDFVLYDSPSGTQPLAFLAQTYSSILVVLCRPSRQFLEGTRHFLFRLLELRRTSLLTVVVTLAAVPMREEFTRQRRQAFERLAEIVLEVSNAIASDKKHLFRIRIPKIGGEPLVIPEVSRLKFQDDVLGLEDPPGARSRAMPNQDPEIAEAVKAYRELAGYLVELHQAYLSEPEEKKEQ